MADERKYYVLCQSNCKFESMTKEQILAAIEQAANDGKITNVDTGFVTKIKELNRRAALSFWVGTTAEYNALETKAENCFYIITDDTTADDVNAMLLAHEKVINETSDYVVAQGTIKPYSFSPFTWNYRKWNNGDYEVWTRYTTAPSNICRPWGALYISGTAEETSFFSVEIPRDFKSIDVVNINAEKAGYIIWAIPDGLDQSGTLCDFYVCATSAITNLTFDVMISIKGKWK